MGQIERATGAAAPEDPDGIRLDPEQPYWELRGATDFARLLRALADFLPAGSVLYFEGGSPAGDLLAFLQARSISAQTPVAVGTRWPRPACFHVPAVAENLSALADFAEHCAAPELAVHFHAYREGKILLEWHDAFALPMLLAGDLPEECVQSLAQALGMKVRGLRMPERTASAGRAGGGGKMANAVLLAAPVLVLMLGLTGTSTMPLTLGVVLLALLIVPLLVLRLFRGQGGRLTFPAFLWIFVPVLCLSLEMTRLPLRIGYALSKGRMERIDQALRRGEAAQAPFWAGTIRVRQAEIRSNGITCLWTRPDAAGSSGFVKTPPERVPFNLWSMTKLDGDWQFIVEE